MQKELTDAQMDEIIDLIYGNQKIAACKRYMELHEQDLGDMPSLLEAKKFIEKLTDELRMQHPERFTNTKTGCFAVLLTGVAMCGLAAWWLLERWA